MGAGGADGRCKDISSVIYDSELLDTTSSLEHELFWYFGLVDTVYGHVTFICFILKLAENILIPF